MNFRLYYGGVFVTNQKKRVTTYEPLPSTYHGLSLHPNVEEACYFEFSYWIKHELKFESVGQIWFRRRGCTLFTGRKELKSDREIPELLESPESDGWYNLYVVHHEGVTEEVDDVGNDGSENLEDVASWFNVEELMQSAENRKVVGESCEMVPPQHKDNPRSENTKLQSTLSTHNQPYSSSHHTHNQRCSSSHQKVSTSFSARKRANPKPRSKKWVSAIEQSEQQEVDEDVSLTDSEGSDFEVSDGEDEDLFAENLEQHITESVSRSLGGGARLPVAQIEYEGPDGGGETGIINLDDDVDLGKSDSDVESLPDSDDDRGIHYPVFNPNVDFKDKVKLCLGQKFPSVYVFTVDHGYNYYFLQNDSKRVTVYCVNKCGCNWKHSRIVSCTCQETRKCKFKVHCKKVKGEATLQIKSLRMEHICGRQHVNNKVTARYLAERFIDEWRDTPSWKLRDFMVRARRVVGVQLGYYKCYRARQIAMQMIHGDFSEQYKRVWDYCEAIRACNPGSTAIVKCIGIEHPPPLFQRMYVCLQPCKEGFVAGCRPILGLDGCHLRGPVPGICLAAVAKDGNNNLFPVAWAIVEVENAETWEWFLELLVADLASVAQHCSWVGDTGVTYMSDRQKGLLDAFKKVVPRAEIRFCCRHIWANFKLKFSGTFFKQYFYKAARATTKFHFDQQMEAIKLISQEAFDYLNKIPACHWSRHAFGSSCKSGMLVNNVVESFNNVLREARSMPILGMMEWIRRWVMKRCCVKREGLEKFDGEIMPSVVRMIERASEEVKKCDVTRADVHEFEVDHVTTGETYVVNLQRKTCGCFRWELMGIPCYHALACIAMQRYKWEDYVHPAYHVATYAKTYAPSFHPMPGKNQWPRSGLPGPLPPPFKKQPGRPKGKKRIKEPGEGEDAYVQRPKKQNTCKKCGRLGHYQKTCKNPPLQVPPTLPESHTTTATPMTTTNTPTQVAAMSSKKRGRPPTNASKGSAASSVISSQASTS